MEASTPRRWFSRWLLMLLIGIGVVVWLAGRAIPALWLFFHLLTGWIRYPQQVLSKVSVNWWDVGLALACMVLLAVGLHNFLSWLFAAMQSDQGLEPPARHWRPLWTASLLALVMIAFAAGICTVAVVHQLGWLFSSPEPVFTS